MNKNAPGRLGYKNKLRNIAGVVNLAQKGHFSNGLFPHPHLAIGQLHVIDGNASA